MTDNRDESLIDKVKNAFGMGDEHHDHDDDHGAGDVGGADDTRFGSTETIDVTHASDDYRAPAATEPVDRPLTDDLPESEDRAEGWAGVDGALGGAGERSTYGTGEPEDPDRR